MTRRRLDLYFRGVLRLPFGMEPDFSELSTGMLWLRLRRGRVLPNVAKVSSVDSQQSHRAKILMFRHVAAETMDEI